MVYLSKLRKKYGWRNGVNDGKDGFFYDVVATSLHVYIILTAMQDEADVHTVN